MRRVFLGKTGLKVSRTGFGALPIQRVSIQTASKILNFAYDSGINFFDTARGYSDSEKKIGIAFKNKRHNIIIATKMSGKTKKEILDLLCISLKQLKTDYVDILQLHNPETLPDPSDENSSYAGLKEAQKKGMVRFIGITTHKLQDAKKSIKSCMFDTLQYPLSLLSSDKELRIIDICQKYNIGLIAMKPLCGGLLTDINLAFSFLWQFENVIPIWGIQRIKEIKQIVELSENPPEISADLKKRIRQERKELGSSFCRGCGYCLPCPAEIPISMAARMKFLLRRSPYKNFLTPQWQENMLKIRNCTNCGSCKSKCPYNLDTPIILKDMLDDYIEFARNKGIIINRREK
ncbi:MAG: General stress protein 69 [candidate division TA06 bacterium ADurb.Bin131]|uniref:General stress protein 69 n=1 Tax=candidate division TA06 bacterium ADurb.Bin131 TaxID=1852827 RepID=A0A1V6C503_UNCT6|nr:MAG: General stress protein 69 [candidate division TA06 bacterium ADurb.Bin131]